MEIELFSKNQKAKASCKMSPPKFITKNNQTACLPKHKHFT